MKGQPLVLAGMALLGGAAIGWVGRYTEVARANIPPVDERLFYSGVLFDGSKPVNGRRSVGVRFFNLALGGGEPFCSSPIQQVDVTKGAFRVNVSDCGDALQQAEGAFVEVVVDGELIPAAGEKRPRVGAVPYAIQAESASTLREPLAAAQVVTADGATVDARLSALQAQLDTMIAPGTVIAFAGDPCPAGFLEADGTSVFRSGPSGYPSLFAAIGVRHGAADANHFNLPDYRGRFLRGTTIDETRDPEFATRLAMNVGGATEGVGSVQDDAFASHNHHLGWGPFPLPFQSGPLAHPNHIYPGPSDELFTGARGGTETRPKNASVLFCVRL